MRPPSTKKTTKIMSAQKLLQSGSNYDEKKKEWL